MRDSIFSFQIPYFNNSDCDFLSAENRNTPDRRSFDGKLIRTNREELYTICNIDTLKIVGDKLFYIKQKSRSSKGYMFE